MVRSRRLYSAALAGLGIAQLAFVGCGGRPRESQTATDPLGHGDARARMVTGQLERRGITDPEVLSAMGTVPRERFVPPGARSEAYDDHPLAIGFGQTISQPYVVAFMTQALELDGDERVLEVGTGSGYQAAVLAEIVEQVFTIEIVPELAARATEDLAGYDNVTVREADGYRGWPEHAPFDAILLAAAPDHVPAPLLDQLAVGGRMILPLGDFEQHLVLIERTPSGFEERRILPVRFVPMTGTAQGD